MMLKRFVKPVVLSLALGGAMGCGDPLVDGEYAGEPLYVVQGVVKSLAPAEKLGKTRVLVAWDNWARNGDLVSLQSVELTSRNPPFDFQLRIAAEPDASALNDFQPGLIGFGYIFVFEDLDGNARPGARDQMRGMAPNHAVLFVPELTEELKASLRTWGRITNVDALKQGFNLARGVCAPIQDAYDDLEIIPDEPVLVADIDAPGETSCLDYH